MSDGPSPAAARRRVSDRRHRACRRLRGSSCPFADADSDGGELEAIAAGRTEKTTTGFEAFLPPLVRRPERADPGDEATPVIPRLGHEGTVANRRVRNRLARLTPGRPSSPAAVEPILRALRAAHPKAEVGLVKRAYEFAERAHEGQVRRSGDPYITHPLAVAGILADLGMDAPDACCGAAARHGRGHRGGPRAGDPPVR